MLWKTEYSSICVQSFSIALFIYVLGQRRFAIFYMRFSFFSLFLFHLPIHETCLLQCHQQSLPIIISCRETCIRKVNININSNLNSILTAKLTNYSNKSNYLNLSDCWAEHDFIISIDLFSRLVNPILIFILAILCGFTFR